MSYKVVAQLLDSKKNVTKDVAKACWLALNAEGLTQSIEIGHLDHSQCNHAMNYWVDDHKFGFYDHPASDFARQIHVYASCNGNVYTENGAVVKSGGSWWYAHVRKPNSHYEIQLARKLDPVDHSDELVAKQKEAGADLTKQENTRKYEQQRAGKEGHMLLKHPWGDFHEYNFVVWIAHERKLGEHFLQVVNEPDLEKALKVRRQSIDGKIEYEEFVAPVVRAAYAATQAQVKALGADAFSTDTPDLSGEQDERVVEHEPVIFPYVANRKITTRKLDLWKLPKGTVIYVWRHMGNGEYRDTSVIRTWDPSPTDPKALMIQNELMGWQQQGCAVNVPAASFKAAELAE